MWFNKSIYFLAQVPSMFLFSYILSKSLEFFPDKSFTLCENHESQCKILATLPISFLNSSAIDLNIASITLEHCWRVLSTSGTQVAVED